MVATITKMIYILELFTGPAKEGGNSMCANVHVFGPVMIIKIVFDSPKTPSSTH